MEPELRPDLPDGAVMENGMKNQTTSAHRFYGRSTIWGKDAEHDTPYMTRWWIGRLRLHVFHRGDQDPDPHDHPWDFWTFPFTPYVEEVAVYSSIKALADMRAMHDDGMTGDQINEAIERGRKVGYVLIRQVVPAFRLTFRPASHTHRVLGRYDRRGGDGTFRPGWDPFFPGDGTVDAGPAVDYSRPIVTLVLRSKTKRKWGFLKTREGKWCWIAWKQYVFGEGGKSAPCE